MSRRNGHGKRWWAHLLGSSAGKQRTRRTVALHLETLEDRLTPSTFTDAGTQLNLVLSDFGSQVSVQSLGSSYHISLDTGTWSGTDDANVTGNGTATLTVTPAGLAAFTQAINFTDSGTGTGIAFVDSGSNSYSNNFTINLSDDPNSPALRFVSGSTSFSGNSSLTAVVDGTILLSAASVTTANGNLSLTGTGDTTAPFGGFSLGILMESSSTITSTGSGAITLVGNGNSTISNINQNGVDLFNSQVVSSGTGSITINGTSAANASTDTFGVFINGPNAGVTSASGDIHITGQANGGSGTVNNGGVLIDGTAVVQAGGNGNITITGTGSPQVVDGAPGIAIAGQGAGPSVVSTVNGTIMLNGTGGGGLSEGIGISGGSTVISTGLGSINATGNSIAGGQGVYLTSNGSISATAGAVNVTGTAGPSASNTVGGVQVDTGGLVTSASGGVTLSGFSGPGPADGILISSGAAVNSGGAFVFLNSFGPLTVSDSMVFGAGNVTLSSATSPGIGEDLSIKSASQVTSSGGRVNLDGGDNVTVDGSSSISASAGIGVGGGAPSVPIAVVSLLGTFTNTSTIGSLAAGSLSPNSTIVLNPVSAPATLLTAMGSNDAYFVQLGHLTGTVQVTDSGGGNASLTITGAVPGVSYTVNGTQTQSGTQTVAYDATVKNILVQGTGLDTFTVTPSLTALLTINGGPAVTAPQNSLVFNQPVGLFSTLTNQTATSGTYVTPGGYQNVNFLNIGTFTPNNLPPVNIVPPAVITNKNVAVAITGLSVSDPNPGTPLIQMNLTVVQGTLTVNTSVAGGLTAGNVMGSGTTTVMLFGTRAQIDATLAAGGLVYTPNAGFAGADQLTVMSIDQGITGVGGPKIATNIVPITVVSVVQEVNSLIAVLQADVAAGILTNGQATSEINSTLKKITETTGLSDITKFMGDISKLVSQGKLSAANAAPLLAAAATIQLGL